MIQTLDENAAVTEALAAKPRLRIGFDTPASSGGPGRYVRALVDALSGDDWEPVIVNPQPSGKEGDGQPDGNSAGGVSKKRGSLRTGLAAAIPRPAKIWAGFGRDALAFSQVISGQRIDLMHLQKTGCEESPVSARLASVPAILGTFHVSPSLDLQRVRSGLAHRPLEWISNHSLHAAIAVSEATRRDWISRTRIPAERVVTIHNGIDPNHFRRGQSQRAARGKLGLPADAIILGGLGRLDPAKGFAWLIEALAILRSEHPLALVAIAGAGPLREELAAQAAAAGVADRVVFLGFQSDVTLVLDACDVFVLSSLSEALPFALLEAMAHELPAVGTTVGGVPEVIIPGETGFLAAPRDPTSLAAAIRPLLLSAELRERMGRAARERVFKHFHEADMVRKTIEVYHQVLGNRPPRRADR